MVYYLLSSQQYEAQIEQPESSAKKVPTDQLVAWSLDRTKCIVEIAEGYIINEYIMAFATANECNEYRYAEANENWRDWLTEEDYYGF